MTELSPSPIDRSLPVVISPKRSLRSTAALSAAVFLASLSFLLLVSSLWQNAFAQDDEAPPTKPPLKDYFVTLETTRGPIVIEVFYPLVPYTAGNFLNLVNRHFYNGLTFHRVESWVIQGGDPTGTGNGGYVNPETGQPVYLKLEINRKLNHNNAGMVAMARSTAPDSASSQFYIIKQAMPGLNGKYAVFGRVVKGLENVFTTRQGDRITNAYIMNLPAEQEQDRPDDNSTPQLTPGVPMNSGF